MTSSFTCTDLTIIRRAYATQMLAIAGVADNSRLEEAFAAIPRERFLGPPPWRFSRAFGYETLPSAEPVLVYQDILLALSADRGVNNGSPSLHAKWLHAVQPRDGERIIHVGAGAGYYSAIMAELVGERGRLTAVEVDPVLAEMARGNLADRANVIVSNADGITALTEPADIIYVNFAVERPIQAWTDYLAIGGRLIFPLGVAPRDQVSKTGRHSSHGAALLVERAEVGLAVRWLGPAWFVCADGDTMMTEAEGNALKAAFERGGVEFVRSLHWQAKPPSDRTWHSGSGWHLSYDPVPA
jgi:protein-L-isoaspartate(D-aspartate) O-methyltransferase